MSSNRAYKFRLYPTPEQEMQLVAACDAVRWIWNNMLEANITQYALDKKFIWSKTYQSKIPNLKKEHIWLKDAPSQSLQQKCDDLEKALKMTSSKRSKRFGFPKFKSKHMDGSYRIPQQANQIKAAKFAISIPKIGKISWVRHRNIIGQLRSVTIKQEGKHWYASVLCKIDDPIEIPYTKDETVGIDFGIKTFLVLSNGTEINTQNFYKNAENQVKLLNNALSRKKKGSKRREKAKNRLKKLHVKIKNQRNDFLHKESRKIANSYKCVIVEDLNLDQMKKRFGKSISDQGYGMFVSQLAYKVNKLIKIDRYFPSSQMCSGCGRLRPEMKNLATRTISCSDCGHEMDRDLNAAINIFTAGTAGWARGEDNVVDSGTRINDVSSMKREKFSKLLEKPLDL